MDSSVRSWVNEFYSFNPDNNGSDKIIFLKLKKTPDYNPVDPFTIIFIRLKLD